MYWRHRVKPVRPCAQRSRTPGRGIGRAASLRTICLLAWLLLSGCASQYFHPEAPPAAPLAFRLADLPYSEYWTGLVFNGQKIGFSRFSIRPAAEPGLFELNSEASMTFRFLGLEKKLTLKARDVVTAELSLQRFVYDYDIDASKLAMAGWIGAGRLEAEVENAGKRTRLAIPVAGAVVPTSAINLYPALHGLAVGREVIYTVFNGETQTLAEVIQRVEGFERSDLFEGVAYRVVTTMQGLQSTTWFDLLGRPVFELALGGVMISALEDEAAAKRYLAAASVNKLEALIDFSRIRSDVVIQRPREVSRLKIALQAGPRMPAVPSGDFQVCTDRGDEVICELSRPKLSTASLAPRSPMRAERYLASTLTVPSGDPRIMQLAAGIAGPDAAPLERIRKTLAWMNENVKREAVDVFSALDVLEQGRAECQGHALLFAALARAQAIPTRVVNGIVYAEEWEGFLYHSWNESLVGERWLPIDPTFGQVAADATHVKLVEGESLAELAPLVEWLGKLKVRVVDVGDE